MQFDLSGILKLILATIRDPADVATQIKRMRIPHDASWLALMAAMILMVVVAHFGGLVIGVSPDQILFGSGAFMDIAIIGSATIMLVFVYYYAGRAMNGTGSFGVVLALMAWLQIVTFAIAALQVLSLLVLPFISPIVSLVGAAIQIVCLLNFLKVAHDFPNLWKAGGLIVVSLIGLAFGLTIIVVMVQAVTFTGAV